jgi:hypothetical protein
MQVGDLVRNIGGKVGLITAVRGASNSQKIYRVLFSDQPVWLTGVVLEVVG